MASFQRRVIPARHALIDTSTLWRAGLALLGVGAFIVARACGCEFDTVTSYVAYFGLYVALPGVVAMYLFNRGPVSLANAFALALPTGFALEIFTYLGLSALDAKLAYVWMPLGWLALAVAIRVRRGEWPVRVRVSGHHAGIFAERGVVCPELQRADVSRPVCPVALAVQTSLWWMRNSSGLRDFLHPPADIQPDRYMQELQEALLWVRNNTERNAVLVANACTPENMKKDHWGALDRTLTGVHFYYSALSERRMWFEGPNYILDTTRARLRASMASNFFYRRKPLLSTAVSHDPTYVLLDRSLGDGAEVTLPLGRRVFYNT